MDKNCSITVGENTGKKRPAYLIYMVYSVFVVSALWGNFIKVIVSFVVEALSKDEIMIRFIGVLWQLQVCLNATIMVKASHPRFGNQIIACQDCFSKVLPNAYELGIHAETRLMRRNLMIISTFGWTVILFNVITIIVIFTLPPEIIKNNFVTLFTAPLPLTIPTKTLAAIIHVFNSVAWILPMLYFVSMTTVIKSAFCMCNKALQSEIAARESGNDMLPTKLADIRTLHLEICKTVELLDKDFRYILACLYMTSIPLSCFIVYNFIKTQHDLFDTILYVFWGIAGDCNVTITSLFAASLHCSVSIYSG